jgi:hypothetical protein
MPLRSSGRGFELNPSQFKPRRATLFSSSTKPLSSNFSIAYSEITRVTPRFPSPSHLENKEFVHRGLKEISPSAGKTTWELINEIVEELV